MRSVSIKRCKLFAYTLMLLLGVWILLQPSSARATILEEPNDIILVVEALHSKDGSLYEQDTDYEEGDTEFWGHGAILSIDLDDAKAMPGETIKVDVRLWNGFFLQKLVCGTEEQVARAAGTDITEQKEFVMWDRDETLWVKAVVRDRLATEPRKINVVCSSFDANGIYIEEEGGTAKADKTEAVPGEEVHITATPAEGFFVQGIEWGSGTTMGKDITKTGTFKMWDETGDVVVDVCFQKDKGDAKDLSGATVTGIVDKEYTGKEITQKPVVTLDGTKLKKDTDYTIEYNENVEVGTAYMLILGKGGYVGRIQKTFKIKRAAIAKATVSGLSPVTWTGRAIKLKPTLRIGKTILTPGEDYSLTYSNNKNVGLASILITGQGNYTGKIAKTFKILPEGTVITKVKNGIKQITIEWKQQPKKMSVTKITGYQLSYSPKKDFSSGVKTVRIKGYKPTSVTIPKVRILTPYYYRIRTYKAVDGVNYYSEWSTLKKKTLKK